MKQNRLLILLFALAEFLFLTGQSESPGNPGRGKIIFEKHCSSCHRKSGGGLGPSTHMPNFSDKRYQESHSDKELFEKVSRGIAGSGMPAWEKSLSAQERWDVVSYIKMLGTH